MIERSSGADDEDSFRVRRLARRRRRDGVCRARGRRAREDALNKTTRGKELEKTEFKKN